MSQINILLAEDDKEFGMILKAFLNAKGFAATWCINGEQALQEFKQNEYDLCLFDISMPEMDGFTLTQKIKESSPRIPVIFLTALKERDYVLRGFELGADDYITKPVDMEELLCRIRAVHRRSLSIPSSPTNFKLGSFTFDAARHTLANSERNIKLTSKESDLLLLLCENMGKTLERPIALSKIWNEVSQENARSMDVYITKLRKFLKDEPNVQLLNVHGVGFKLLAKE